MDSRPDNVAPEPFGDAALPDACLAIARRLFSETVARRWRLSCKVFEDALARSARKRLGARVDAREFAGYVSTLHLEDLALACACLEGSEAAWEEFAANYRGYLRAASAAILRCAASDPSAIELADSLLTDLYGLSGQSSANRSLFRYFHGRSSLKTWLRAVLAQRHVDRIRAGKRFAPLDEQPSDGEPRRQREPVTVEPPADPRREHYLQLFREALRSALASLDARDRTRLQLYYAEDRTLAEIGRAIGEHESSVSRHLERVRKELRATVEGWLRAGSGSVNGGAAPAGLDDAQVALSIEYAAEDAGIDLDQLFHAAKPQDLPSPKPKVKP
jgi:RNA polymerase sigma-70 factor